MKTASAAETAAGAGTAPTPPTQPVPSLDETVGSPAETGVPASDEAAAPGWPDESAEASFLAEARERGEPVADPKRREEPAEENDTGALPGLDDLVQRIPPEVRETLDELFRVRFVRVQRVPKKALKG